MSVTIPAGWHQEEKDGMVTAGSVDGTVSVFLQVLDATTLENIGDHVNEHLKDLVSDPRPNKKGNNEEINGLKVYSVRGTGSKDGKPCEWVVDFVASKKILMLVYVGETAGLQQNQARLATMIASIKPTEDAPTAAATSASEAQDAVSEAVATASPEAR